MKYMLVVGLACISLFGSYATASASDYALIISVWMEDRWRIATTDEDGSDLTFLTDPTSSNSGGVWSPDGKKIAFVSGRDWNDEIYVMNADGTDAVRLTNHLGNDFSPSWSPDGRRIAFTSSRGNKSQIYVVNSDGTSVVRLTNLLYGASSPTWLPNGKIAFMSRSDIYAMDADGANIVNLTNGMGLVRSFSWWVPRSPGKDKLFTQWGWIKS